MQFADCLAMQMRLHPSMEPRDALKLCFQAAFGAEHLLDDVEAAKRYFDEEYTSVCAAKGALKEPISPEFCRVNLAVWKGGGLPRERLFELFRATAAGGAPENCGPLFERYMCETERYVRRRAAPFSPQDWRDFTGEYLKGGVRALHHSEGYRRRERPSYRVVSAALARIEGI